MIFNKKKFLKRTLVIRKIQLEKYYTTFFYRILPNIQKKFNKKEFLTGFLCNYSPEASIKITYSKTLLTYEKGLLIINYNQKDMLFVLWYITETIDNCTLNQKQFKIIINNKEKKSLADIITRIWKAREIKIQSCYLSNYITWFERKDGSSDMRFLEKAD